MGAAVNKINKWLKEKTFHYKDFNIPDLVRIKEEKNLKISLCFPTLNEEKTIGKSVVMMKSELMLRHKLIDEIAVIDSGSTDSTCVIAKEFGAQVYNSADYLKDEGYYKGKGENMWKALYLLKGDIIVFIDADISNIHHRFAYGLLGPLLQNPDIRYVKAFYSRPFQNEKGIAPSGGGRVTEILIRPLFSQFFPSLTGIVQPLSGECAGYREIFENISFPVGYGVETGMLIDIYKKWGLDAIAQTNLDLRIHRNQDIASLGKMSFGILQTFWKRLNKYKKDLSLSPEALTLRQMSMQDSGGYEISEKLIEEIERKPIIEVPDYKNRNK
ncbi:MAG: Glycosyl transferase family 2 [Candidatus Uhrbacteria bacterium GW2011_GWF2_39_13]|uniref:Glycosyl transferase family 2 n=1 Tax=Candidatus Uhrbacteria bacterium GW2011_GWF2_39_13 TaxID=1618995 RepID=A0A0G0PZQ5_9BACT|nr:MAG: Glycosyl transferase family 2 [Candidatus Uhrbacteria bacterium GW2011_GWF2_39_13]